MIAPIDVDVRVLSDVLTDQGVEVLVASELGAGVTLAQAVIDEVDCAVAVLPSRPTRSLEGLTAVFIEIGVVAGRRIPILVIVEPPEVPSPALAGATIVRAPVTHADALRLHVRMFMLSLTYGGARQEPHRPLVLDTALLAGFKTRLEVIRNRPQSRGESGEKSSVDRGFQLERLVYDVLSGAGAAITTNVQWATSKGQREADAVAFVPGTESVLGAIIVELKLRRLTEDDLQRAEQQLLTNMNAGRVGFGLLVYDELATVAFEVRTSPFMLALSVDELIAELEHVPLGELLMRARNRAVHGV
ncbi:hypothetical protein SK854_05985 [Lentzea sp. BCCO 10_0061]|uniref:Restriction endonuclease type IV Mrr domain-containing protein n=1 Tax=Lentzea sokolovensis TaxID=3095429 RepID=A0ABU4UQ91_9PSEU|nr:hypothetical protein [Lentzea sp. BCCO 10_0061]MDX8141652.1 hypothetical protein [Lentzea sp. BCCO 10_0061]